MCGIIGYNGCGDATLFIGQGLKNLEYRGYDSYGSGFVTPKALFLHKSTGELPPHYDKFLKNKVESKCGIGHVRWATTGKNITKNSHPHYGGKNKNILLVHNGIISNYQKLKRILLKEGFNFISETDTEVLAHWIHYKNHTQIQGDFACLFIKQNEEVIYAVRRNTPLFLARINDANILSSSLNVFDDLATNYEYVELTNDKIYKIGKTKIDANWREVNNNSDSRRTAAIITLEEIKDQETILHNHVNKLNKTKLVMFGCGSSYNAAIIAKHFFHKNKFSDVEVSLPSEIKELDSKAQYIAISQSGETKDVLDMARKLHHYKLCAITNRKHNTLENLADKTIYLNCGIEIGVAATKSFTSTLNTLCQLAGERINEAALSRGIHKVLNTHYPKVPKSFKRFNNIFLFGSGVIHHVNCEGALKLKEMAHTHAEAINIAEMKHGPITLIDRDNLSIFVTEDQKTLESIEQVKARNGEVLLLTVPKMPSELENLILVSIYLQIIALELGRIRGINVDRPVNLAKCITI